jgi:hypothetical protein
MEASILKSINLRGRNISVNQCVDKTIILKLIYNLEGIVQPGFGALKIRSNSFDPVYMVSNQQFLKETRNFFTT